MTEWLAAWMNKGRKEIIKIMLFSDFQITLDLDFLSPLKVYAECVNPTNKLYKSIDPLVVSPNL